MYKQEAVLHIVNVSNICAQAVPHQGQGQGRQPLHSKLPQASMSHNQPPRCRYDWQMAAN